MRKRAHALLLSICLALSLAIPAQAAEDVKLDIVPSVESVESGDTVTVEVNLSENPGLASIKFKLTYDKKLLKCVEVENGPVLSGTLALANPDASGGVILGSASATDRTSNGLVATFSFQALKDGDLEFGITDAEFGNVDAEHFDYVVTGGAKKEPSKPALPEKETEDEEKEARPQKPEEVEEGRFTDTGGHPSESFIYEAVDRGFFQGYADGSFKPNGNVTRGAFVTVLWRMAGRPEPTNTTPFTDIGNVSAEFQKAIAWAYGKGYINGRTATTFAPGDSMSRQATMKILFHHYGGGSGEELMYYGIYDSYFTDGATLNEQFKAPMYWGIYNGLIEGNTETTLGGPTVANRALLATTLVKYTDRFGN